MPGGASRARRLNDPVGRSSDAGLDNDSMTISILLRLRSDGLLEGQIAGHAEVVDTGDTRTFGHVADLVAFLEASIASSLERAPDRRVQSIARHIDPAHAD